MPSKNVEIKSIKKIPSQDRYDLEVEGNHNFFANAILVHNCRCICRKDGMWSRNGKPIISAQHIREALEPLFQNNPKLILDGELYCDKLNNDFNKIISLVKKSKPSLADLKESSEIIQYWIYDIPSSAKKGFKQRNDEINALLNISATPAWLLGVPSCLVNVETTFLHDQKQLDDLYGKYLDHGFEGQMIRSMNGLYENKRSKNLLKRKEFIDSEYTVIDVCEGAGNRSGTAGWLVLKLEDGRTFKSNIKGNFEYLRKLLVDKKELIGKLVTVKYFQLTPDGIPRFPYMTSVRDYE
jgi:DNA ligase-1